MYYIQNGQIVRDHDDYYNDDTTEMYTDVNITPDPQIHQILPGENTPDVVSKVTDVFKEIGKWFKNKFGKEQETKSMSTWIIILITTLVVIVCMCIIFYFIRLRSKSAGQLQYPM